MPEWVPLPMLRLVLVPALLSVICEAPRAAAAETPQPRPLDAEYRKLDGLASLLRARNTERFAISPGQGIDERRFVTLGGIEQWITIRGLDRGNPVLLFLHGGPGDVTNPWAFTVFAPWEEHFTVVQWDQRGAGRTLRRTGPATAATLTVERLVQDGLELVEHLRETLGKDKLFLVGHSFGSILGVRMAAARPDLFHAYVGTGQVADATRSAAVAHEALLKKARAAGHLRALEELGRVGPPPYPTGEGHGVQRKWANAFEGADAFLAGTLGLALVAPGGSVEDINDSVEGQILSGERLAPQTRSLEPRVLGLEFSIPIFVFQGAEDFTTPTLLAREYLRSIKAPRKAFVALEGGGHFAVFMRSERFLAELVRRVRPLAAAR